MREQCHFLTPPAPGTTRELLSLHFGPAASGRKAYLQAALHADEPPGLLVAWHLRQMLAEAEAAGRLTGEIVLVPMANPIGHAQRLLGRGRRSIAARCPMWPRCVRHCALPARISPRQASWKACGAPC
mgnify:CR=1 FL=1